MSTLSCDLEWPCSEELDDDFSSSNSDDILLTCNCTSESEYMDDALHRTQHQQQILAQLKRKAFQNTTCCICFEPYRRKNLRVYLNCEHSVCMLCANILTQRRILWRKIRCPICRENCFFSSQMLIFQRRYSKWSIRTEYFIFFRARFVDYLEENILMESASQQSPLCYRSKSRLKMNVSCDLDELLEKYYIRYQKNEKYRHAVLYQIVYYFNSGQQMASPMYVDYKNMSMRICYEREYVKLYRLAKDIKGIGGYIFADGKNKIKL